METLGTPRVIKYCCYRGQQRGTLMKPTAIWTNLGEWWRPACEQTDGTVRWQRQCTHCQACREGFLHDVRIIRRSATDKRPGPTEDGYNPDAARNRMPPALAAELGRAAEERRRQLSVSGP